MAGTLQVGDSGYPFWWKYGTIVHEIKLLTGSIPAILASQKPNLKQQKNMPPVHLISLPELVHSGFALLVTSIDDTSEGSEYGIIMDPGLFTVFLTEKNHHASQPSPHTSQDAAADAAADFLHAGTQREESVCLSRGTHREGSIGDGFTSALPSRRSSVRIQQTVVSSLRKRRPIPTSACEFIEIFQSNPISVLCAYLLSICWSYLLYSAKLSGQCEEDPDEDVEVGLGKSQS